MDNNTVIDQLSTEVDNLMRIYRGLAPHVDGGPPGISQLRSQGIRQLGTAIQSVDIHGYEAFVPHAVSALMLCAPVDMPPSKRIALQEDAKSAFETGVGLPHVIKQLGSQQQTRQLSQDHRRVHTL